MKNMINEAREYLVELLEDAYLDDKNGVEILTAVADMINDREYNREPVRVIGTNLTYIGFFTEAKVIGNTIKVWFTTDGETETTFEVELPDFED